MRKRNLVFFGIEECENFELQNKILDIINEEFQVKCEDIEIQDLYRIGKRSTAPRPVVVCLTTLCKKLTILRESKTVQSTHYVKEDFPINVLIKRRELQKLVKSEREKGRKVMIKYYKLIYLDENKDSATQNSNKPIARPPAPKTSNKRNLPISPETSGTSQATRLNDKTTQAQKKNKTIRQNEKHGSNLLSSFLTKETRNADTRVLKNSNVPYRYETE